MVMCGFKFEVQRWFKLELTPHTNGKYQKYAIESINGDKTPDIDYGLEIIDLQLYLMKGRVSSSISKSESYEYTEIRCQAQTITNNSLLNKAFVVNENAHTFTIAYQQGNAGDNTDFPKTKFIIEDGYEKNICFCMKKC